MSDFKNLNWLGASLSLTRSKFHLSIRLHGKEETSIIPSVYAKWKESGSSYRGFSCVIFAIWPNKGFSKNVYQTVPTYRKMRPGLNKEEP